MFAIASTDGQIKFWEPRKNLLVESMIMPNNNSISAIQFTRKRNVMFVAHSNKVTVINLQDNARQRSESF